MSAPVSVSLPYADPQIPAKYLREAQYLVLQEAASHGPRGVASSGPAACSSEAAVYERLPPMRCNLDNPSIAAEYALALHVKLLTLSRAGILRQEDLVEGAPTPSPTTNSPRKRPRSDEGDYESQWRAVALRELRAQRQRSEREATYANAQRHALHQAAARDSASILSATTEAESTTSELKQAIQRLSSKVTRFSSRFDVYHEATS